MEIEEWRQIINYPNYQISSLGRLKNKNTIQKGTDMNGYIRTKLTNEQGTKSFLMHRLVALHFLPNLENKLEVNHLGEKSDNRVCMLEWTTRKENAQHAAINITKYDRHTIYKINPNTKQIIHIYNSKTDAIADSQSEYMFYKVLNTDRIMNGYLWKSETVKDIVEYVDEIWVDLKNSIYQEVNIFTKYQVSNYGRIKGHYNKLLSLNDANNIYTIKLANDEKTITIKIHRLILMAFNIPNPENKQTVDHIDSNNKNNKLENLRWATHKEQGANINTLNNRSNINIKKRKQIKAITDQNEIIYNGINELANQINSSPTTINKYIQSGKKFKNTIFIEI